MMQNIQRTRKKQIFPQTHQNTYQGQFSSYANPFKNNKNVQRSNDKDKLKTSIQSIMNSLVLPCCGQNMIKCQDFLLNKFTSNSLFIMPCGHNICQKCICTILEFKTDNKISCSHRQCTRNYSVQEAEQYFIKNNIVVSYLERMYQVKNWIYQISEKEQPVNQLSRSKSLINVSGNKSRANNEPKFIQMEQKRQKSSSRGSSAEQVFSQCTNIFCKKPTLGLFCSNQCQVVQNKLEQDLVQNIKIINNHVYQQYQRF